MGLDDFRRMVVKRANAQPKARVINYKVLPSDETIRLHCIEKRGIVRPIARTQVQVTQAIGSPRFLRHCSERPCDTCARKGDKLAPPHRFPRVDRLPPAGAHPGSTSEH